LSSARVLIQPVVCRPAWRHRWRHRRRVTWRQRWVTWCKSCLSPVKSWVLRCSSDRCSSFRSPSYSASPASFDYATVVCTSIHALWLNGLIVIK